MLDGDVGKAQQGRHFVHAHKRVFMHLTEQAKQFVIPRHRKSAMNDPEDCCIEDARLRRGELGSESLPPDSIMAMHIKCLLFHLHALHRLGTQGKKPRNRATFPRQLSEWIVRQMFQWACNAAGASSLPHCSVFNPSASPESDHWQACLKCKAPALKKERFVEMAFDYAGPIDDEDFGAPSITNKDKFRDPSVFRAWHRGASNISYTDAALGLLRLQRNNLLDPLVNLVLSNLLSASIMFHHGLTTARQWLSRHGEDLRRPRQVLCLTFPVQMVIGDPCLRVLTAAPPYTGRMVPAEILPDLNQELGLDRLFGTDLQPALRFTLGVPVWQSLHVTRYPLPVDHDVLTAASAKYPHAIRLLLTPI